MNGADEPIGRNPFDSPIVRAGMYLFAGMLVITGGFAAYFQITEIREAWESQDWPVAVATIRSARVEQFHDGRRVCYVPRLTYDFVVDGRTFVGRSIDIREAHFDDTAQARAVVELYEVGSRHSVSYNPLEPRVCYLRPSLPTAKTYALLVVPPLMWVFACALVVVFAPNRPAAAVEPALADGSDGSRFDNSVRSSESRALHQTDEVTTFEVPLFDRCIDAVIFFFVSFAVGLGLCVWVLQEIVLPDATPQFRFLLGLFLAVPIALLVAWRRFAVRIHCVFVSPSQIELRRQQGVQTISSARVRGLLGLPGISLDGGEIIVWSKLVILTPEGNHRIGLGKQLTPGCYRALRRACGRAWAIPFRGHVSPPQGVFRRSNAEETLAHLQTFVNRHALWLAALGVGLTVGSVLWTIALIFHRVGVDASIAQGVLCLIVAFIVGTYALLESCRQFLLNRRLDRLRRDPHLGVPPTPHLRSLK